MIFNSFEFIFLFLPITIIGYFTLNKFNNYNLSKIWLIVCSLYFYSYFNPWYLPIILISILVNFFIASQLHKEKYKKNFKKTLFFC